MTNHVACSVTEGNQVIVFLPRPVTKEFLKGFRYSVMRASCTGEPGGWSAVSLCYASSIFVHSSRSLRIQLSDCFIGAASDVQVRQYP